MTKMNEIYQAVLAYYEEREDKEGISAKDLSIYLKLDRTTTSRYLNDLYKEKLLEKSCGRPVLYRPLKSDKYHYADQAIEINNQIKENSVFQRVIGFEESLSAPIQQAKAAILYPPNGLHSILLGETGVGKTMFAELMHRFAIESKNMEEGAPFITFNCADYANNPQLLLGQLFGVKKGAYTGAEKDKKGLLEKADGGILFLDEIHRLPPEGQEMLFTFIDKGYFRRLGDTDELICSKVLIISATTENMQSYLLKTFIRRIPMMIHLPSLRDRSLKERFDLIEFFFVEESKRIGKSIYISENALTSLLLYDCSNNIGQLKSDIQLGCAKAFIHYKSKNKYYIMVNSIDLPQYVKSGMMKIKYLRDKVEKIINLKEGILKFDGDTMAYNADRVKDHREVNNFYNFIEEKVLVLKSMGMEEEEIKKIVNIDIEKHFKKYVEELPNPCEKEEILNVVEKKILDVTEEVLKIAGEGLKRQYDNKIYYGLAMHMNATFQRIRNGNKIYNPKLNAIRTNYPDEFMTAMRVAKIIESSLNIELPLDEIGYIAMFLSAAMEGDDHIQNHSKVGVLVIMHGVSTASSMVEVANKLVGQTYGAALDMPLDMTPEESYKKAKEKAIELDEGRGVLFMIDMGSPSNFGEMIHEETGIETMTIEMTTTLLVLEACRKGVMGNRLKQIYDACISINRYHQNPKKLQGQKKRESYAKNVIITTCFTGKGAAESIKTILCEKLDTNSIEIIALNILDKQEFFRNVQSIKSQRKILAIIGTLKITLEDIPFISLQELLLGEDMGGLQKIVEIENMYYRIGQSLKNHLHTIDSFIFVFHIRNTLEKIQKSLNMLLDKEVLVGIVIHICFLIEKLKNGEVVTIYKEKEEIFSKYKKEYEIIKREVKGLENFFDIIIDEDEICYLTKMIVENYLNSM